MKKRKDAVRLCLSFLAAGLVLAIPVAAEEPLPEFGVLTQEEPALEDL